MALSTEWVALKTGQSGSGGVEYSVKDPEPLLKCIENSNVSKEEVIYIGDALSDQQSSINAGIDFGYAK